MQHQTEGIFAGAAAIPYEQLQTTPILDVAARVWEADRYACFRVCYASMRLLDDLVDNAREQHRERLQQLAAGFAALLNDGLHALRTGHSDDAIVRQLVRAREQYGIPFWPWERLGAAMTYDLSNNGFASFHQFLRYCEGAAIAPASIFMHLCGTRVHPSGCGAPSFSIRDQARPLALFAYLTHIARDLFVDHRRGLNYFSDDLLRRFGFDRDSISTCVVEVQQQHPDCRARLIGLLDRWLGIAAVYRSRARLQLDRLAPLLEPRYRVSLDLVFALYAQQHERLSQVYRGLDESVWGVSSDQMAAAIRQVLGQERLSEA